MCVRACICAGMCVCVCLCWRLPWWSYRRIQRRAGPRWSRHTGTTRDPGGRQMSPCTWRFAGGRTLHTGTDTGKTGYEFRNGQEEFNKGFKTEDLKRVEGEEVGEYWRRGRRRRKQKIDIEIRTKVWRQRWFQNKRMSLVKLLNTLCVACLVDRSQDRWRKAERSKHLQPRIPMLSRALMWDNSSCADTFQVWSNLCRNNHLLKKN